MEGSCRNRVVERSLLKKGCRQDVGGGMLEERFWKDAERRLLKEGCRQDAEGGMLGEGC